MRKQRRRRECFTTTCGASPQELAKPVDTPSHPPPRDKLREQAQSRHGASMRGLGYRRGVPARLFLVEDKPDIEIFITFLVRLLR